MLIKARKDKININYLIQHVHTLAKYDISEPKIDKHLKEFLDLLQEENLYG